MLLLDTCSLLWLASDDDALSVKAKKAIMDNAGALFVSSISAFEIAIKTRNGKILLPLPTGEWFTEALDFHGIREIPITGLIAALSVQLPHVHDDPCDRMIIATAQIHAMKICTCDRLIKKYKQVEVVW
jgi:PIN domain nuclease of toxin-antitoxin system